MPIKRFGKQIQGLLFSSFIIIHQHYITSALMKYKADDYDQCCVNYVSKVERSLEILLIL